MKTATVRDLRNHYSSLLRWLAAGEDIVITQRGQTVARLVAEHPAKLGKADWSKSPAVTRDRSAERVLDSKRVTALIKESSGSW